MTDTPEQTSAPVDKTNDVAEESETPDASCMSGWIIGTAIVACALAVYAQIKRIEEVQLQSEQYGMATVNKCVGDKVRKIDEAKKASIKEMLSRDKVPMLSNAIFEPGSTLGKGIDIDGICRECENQVRETAKRQIPIDFDSRPTGMFLSDVQNGIISGASSACSTMDK